ncbi:HD domain-containing protein [Desulfoscipio sp. XC116]|uniref:HD domain-containing protein n=1 Tax=Desulfoscipio sp. XC116 TaxID=3144975 RepID=UPI00325B85D3
MDIISETIKKMLLYFDGDVKRINHALKVYAFAKSIGELEGIPKEKLKILEAAAVLHDIGIKESEIKYSSSSAKYQQLEGPSAARAILKEFNLSKGFIDRISYLIGNHHTYDKIDDVDFQILIEADFLVNIFEDSIGEKQIKVIRKKYFKTITGTRYLDSLYSIQPDL